MVLTQTPTAMTNPDLARTPVQRLLSLDVLRGVTIAFMIMVNNNGGSGAWWFMKHATWNGFTPTDLVFPTFVFVVGVSIVFAYEARLARGATRASLAWHTLRRAAILFLLGFVVNNFPFFKLDNMRVYGVLQRTAICYLVVGLFYLWDKRVWTKVVVLATALVSYWMILHWVPVPGVGTPGRDIPFMDPTKNLAAWLDRVVSIGHLVVDSQGQNPPDPEGLLSDIPAIGTALLGLLTGIWLYSRQTATGAKTAGLAAASAVCLAAGYIWSGSFPLNKHMWTSSFVLVTAGWSLAILTLAYWVVEQRGWGKGKGNLWVYPWLVFGSNAITAYMFSELLPEALNTIRVGSGEQQTNALGWVAYHTVGHISDPGWAAFAYSVSFTAFCFMPVWFLYHKKIFVKV